MGCTNSKGPVPELKQLQGPGALMNWIEEKRATGLYPLDFEGRKIVKAEIIGGQIDGGYMQLTRMCKLTFDDDSTKDAFMKISKNDCYQNSWASKARLDREAIFFNYLKTSETKFQHMRFPEVYVAVSDPKTGRNILIMEFIEGSKNLWGVFGSWSEKIRPDLERPITMGGCKVTAIDCARQIAKSFGELSGTFWMDKEFLAANKEWIHNADWFSGENLKYYDEIMGEFALVWGLVKKGVFKGCVTHKYDPKHNAVVDACIAKSKSKEFQAHYGSESFQWTMCHKDAHPGNYVFDPKKNQVCVIDLELTGLGSGPMDLAVFMVVRSDPVWRRKYEKEIVEAYYEALIEKGAEHGRVTRETYPIEKCWKDYALYGFAKLMMYITQLPSALGHHVIDDLEKSVNSFIEDHGITPENVPPMIW